ncbi:MAG: transketolase C-terminal domain-containing protein [Candidatus Paceibacterota bacterium]
MSKQIKNMESNNSNTELNIELKSMRVEFGAGLVEAASTDERIVALCADLTESTGLSDFKDKFPDRFIQVGVAEQNLATVASGMAAMGKIPFMASYAVFSPGRNWEQIRTTICYNDRPVKIIGSHTGVNVGPDGGSHQALEDIAMMRSLPRMVVISPCDALEAKKAAIAMSKTDSPTYVRLAREKSPNMTSDDTPFVIGKANIIFGGSSKPDVGIISTGAITYEALQAAKKLEEMGKKVTVLNLSTIKPLDRDKIIELARSAGAIVTVEEHQMAGGMGSAVAELLAKEYPVPMEFVAVNDVFGQSGKSDELLSLYGLDRKGIVEAVMRVLKR